ncbi:hypothetical protein HY251_04190 [bacterium]|nr:hypothetical protein [bacterium]
MNADILTLAELRQLRRETPAKLFAHLREVEKNFVFGVEDHREEVDEWGGEFRILVNRNVELHLVPRFNKQMEMTDELPQYAIFPDSELAGTEAEREIVIDDEGETVPAVIFYVEPGCYDRLRDELSEVVRRYEDFDVIPDTYFLETELIRLLATRVLEHEAVKAERAYDFRRGLVGGEPPRDLEEETTDLDHGPPPP